MTSKVDFFLFLAPAGHKKIKDKISTQLANALAPSGQTAALIK